MFDQNKIRDKFFYKNSFSTKKELNSATFSDNKKHRRFQEPIPS